MGILSATPVGPYLLAAKMALIGGAVALIAFLGWRVHADGLTIGADKVVIQQAKVDNEENVKAISVLYEANQKWAAIDAANKVALDGLSDKLKTQAGDLAGVRSRLAASQKAETSPAAVALRATRVDTADPALAARLRSESAANAH